MRVRRADDGLDNVKVWICFHAAPTEEIARSVLRGNFAILQKLDAGFFGQGIYMTLDAPYCIEAYGGETYGLQDAVPVLVCAVVVGNTLPVVEMPHAPDGFLGKPIASRADCASEG